MCASGQLGDRRHTRHNSGTSGKFPPFAVQERPARLDRRAVASLSAGLSKADFRAYAGRRALTSRVVAQQVASLVPVSHPPNQPPAQPSSARTTITAATTPAMTRLSISRYLPICWLHLR
jgi:hypothetical protein